MFKLKNAKIITRPSPNGKVKIRPLRSYRYVIYRYSIIDRVLLKVYDKHEQRYIFWATGKLKNGTKLTDKVRKLYRGHKFIDKIDSRDDKIFEI